MNDYIKVDFTLKPYNEVESDILSSLLCDIGYDSFEPTDTGINAYIIDRLYDNMKIKEVISNYPFNANIVWENEVIKGRDWNEEWEKNYFTPLVINNQCVIHSTFHKDYPSLQYEIIIDPKMAFGTGHHETTSLMVQKILDETIEGENVIDVGAGTGILSILCAKKGAHSVIGIEIDEDAYENSLENIEMNKIQNITMMHGDANLLRKIPVKANLVLANINRNVILSDIDKYSSVLKRGGKMQLSGFYEEDIYVILEEAKKNRLSLVDQRINNKWAMVFLQKD